MNSNEFLARLSENEAAMWKRRNSRGFDGRGEHSNGTAYDDEGYDWMFRSEDGKVREDKVPPFKGAYVLGLLTAIDTAFEMAGMTMGAGYFRNYTMLEVASCVESYEGEDERLPLEECWGSRGTIVMTDAEYGIGNYGFGYTFWDEKTGEKRLDSENFGRALSQIGESILNELEESEPDWKLKTNQYLLRAARLLMTRDLWADGYEQWAVKGVRNHTLSLDDLMGWDDSVSMLAGTDDAPRPAHSQDNEFCDEEMPF